MAEDIAPALLEAIRADFTKALAKLEAEAATWPQAYDYASEVGRALANALQAHLSGDTLPDGKLYWNIADRVVRPMLEQEHTLVAAVAAQVQQNLNEAAGLGLKAQTAALDSDRIDGILNMASNAEKYDTVAGQVSSAVENYSLHAVDETIRQNVEFQGGAGLKPRVIRKAAFGCCPWCTALAGTYTYPGVPKDVWRRHENCNCTVEYDPGDGRRQNVYTKKWSSEQAAETRQRVQQNLQNADLQQQEKSATIEERKIIGLEVNGTQIKGVSDHISLRMQERSIASESIIDAIQNPLHIGEIKIDEQGRPSFQVIGEKATIYINPKTGELATTHATHTKTAERLKKKRGGTT